MINKDVISFIIITVFLFDYINTFASEHKSDQNEATDVIYSFPDENAETVVPYNASFFSRYQPATALDMVRQLPGFLLDNGESIRGFAESVGNVLINDKYPSAKQDTPTAILSRIPASQVEKIELIRGQIRGIDLQGQAVLANIILREDTPVAVQWEYFATHSNTSPFRTGLNVSLSHNWKNIDYNVGVDVERGASGERGPDLVFDGNGKLIEERKDVLREAGLRLTGVYLNTSTWLGNSFIQVNAKTSLTRGPERFTSARTPINNAGPPELQSIKFSEYHPTFEVAMDIERSLLEKLNAKTIFLFTRDNTEFITRQTNVDLPDTRTLFRRSDSKILEKEAIARLELDWSAIPDHNLQLNIEAWPVPRPEAGPTVNGRRNVATPARLFACSEKTS